MKVIEASIIIKAHVDRVWMLLTDLDHYVEWNPFIIFAEGDPAAGQPLRMRRAIDTGRTRRKGTFTEVSRDDLTLSWKTHWITSKFLDTAYSFSVEPMDDETIRFVQRQILKGLVPIILRQRTLNVLQSGMVSTNKALKRLAENKGMLLPQLWTSAR